MTNSSFPPPPVATASRPNFFHSLGQLPGRLKSVPWYWHFIWTYLVVMLVIPTIALLGRSIQLGPLKFWQVISSPMAVSAFEVTFVTALAAAAINGVAGLATAWVLVRYDFPGRRIVDAAIDLPFALPTSVAGLSLATVYSPQGWIGSLFAPLGIKLAFTRWGVLVAMVFISLPFVVRTVQPVLQDLDKEVEEAAECLGATRWQTFWKVILPPLLPAILTGMALGFSRAVGEYGSVVIVAGNLPFKDLIAPVLIIQRLEQYDYVGATVIGSTMLLVSFVILLALNALQVWSRRYDV